MGSKYENNGIWVSAFSPKNRPDPPSGPPPKNILKYRLYCIPKTHYFPDFYPISGLYI